MDRASTLHSLAGRAAGHRTRIRVAAVAAAGTVALTACSGTSGGDDAKGDSGSHRISVAPASGASAVSVKKKVTVRAGSGKLTSVQVTAPGPGALHGSFSKDRSSWTSTARLAPGVTYALTAGATASDGKKLTEHEKFTTAEPTKAQTVIGEYNVERDSTVGVGLPVSIVFNKPVTDKAAVERRLRVTSSPAVVGAWSWLKDRNGKDRVDYRPRTYWKPGTKVSLRMNLDGVAAGGGLYGTQTRKIDFTVRKAVVTTVDVTKKSMTVTRDGEKLRTLPVSTGKKGFETWNGTMVVLSKVPTIRMDSSTVGIFGPEAYDLGKVKWDVQLTTSGTYAHAAPWNEGKFGRVNGSHGCIGMSTSDAKWFFHQVHYGDPVTVVHSKDDTVPVNNGYGDWNVGWAEWQAGSALK
ncbi:Ig-like domain-containing protein [Streptomyces sp. NPDC058371]|uniref:L,D-transpeptidase n=1 Tax=Streptomyces sp. NPDC058371 TaxID=3346463 RepID=UPI00365906F9